MRSLIALSVTALCAALLATGCGSSSEATAQPVAAKTFVVPHIFETSGKVASAAQFSRPVHDSAVFASYSAGIPGVTAAGSGSATVAVHLFHETGAEVNLATLAGACASCVQVLTPSNRKATFDIDAILSSAEVSPYDVDGVFHGFALIVVSGPDAELVNLLSFVAQAWDSPLTISTFGYVPEELPADGA